MTEGDSNVQNMKFKTVFLGDQSVGKTSIIVRFTQDHFEGSYNVRVLDIEESLLSL